MPACLYGLPGLIVIIVRRTHSQPGARQVFEDAAGRAQDAADPKSGREIAKRARERERRKKKEGRNTRRQGDPGGADGVKEKEKKEKHREREGGDQDGEKKETRQKSARI